PSGSGKAGLVSDVGESSVAVVVIEDAAAVLGDVKIGPAGSIVVADRNAHAVASPDDPCLRGNIGEGAIAIVAIERVAQRGARVEEIAFAAVNQINVHPAVVVVIDKATAGAGRLWEV